MLVQTGKIRIFFSGVVVLGWLCVCEMLRAKVSDSLAQNMSEVVRKPAEHLLKSSNMININ